MKIICKVEEIKDVIHQAKRKDKIVGLVPTMGFLHEGHLTLMREAKKSCDLVVASIFVNPLQFGPNEDYEVYPRDLGRDSKLAESAGVDILFTPGVDDMYPAGLQQMLTFVDVKLITDKLCGATRPGHFRGVTTVVTKLFNIVEPHVVYFGQKDAQQVSVIKRMVNDLNINVRVVSVPIVRESDGLALSSRNVFLNPAEREAALILNKSLKLAMSKLEAGERKAEKIKREMEKMIKAEPLATVDYIAIANPDTIEEWDDINGPALIALAVKIGKTRLIDNGLWEG
jgi:pantoate--beta-alanine ligase